MTGSILRTARVLEKNQFEISGGIAKNELGGVTQVVIAAYGVSNFFEIEGRWEDAYFSLTPRFQLLKSEHHWIDCLAFFEIGYGHEVHFLGGPGIMFGKRFKNFSSYIAYKYRHCQNSWEFDDFYHNAHYVKLGGRYYLPHFWKKSSASQSAWFFGAEVGPTIFPHQATIVEWAANIGFNF